MRTALHSKQPLKPPPQVKVNHFRKNKPKTEAGGREEATERKRPAQHISYAPKGKVKINNKNNFIKKTKKTIN